MWYTGKDIIQSIALKHWFISFREVMSYIPILVPIPKAFYVNQRFRQKKIKTKTISSKTDLKC